jgi:hypothetical protein
MLLSLLSTSLLIACSQVHAHTPGGYGLGSAGQKRSGGHRVAARPVEERDGGGGGLEKRSFTSVPSLALPPLTFNRLFSCTRSRLTWLSLTAADDARSTTVRPAQVFVDEGKSFGRKREAARRSPPQAKLISFSLFLSHLAASVGAGACGTVHPDSDWTVAMVRFKLLVQSVQSSGA